MQLSRVNGSHAVVVLELPQADGEEISEHFSREDFKDSGSCQHTKRYAIAFL